MAKLYLIRHGETDYNKALRFQGHTDIPLNREGLEQAQKMAAYFRTTPLAAVYSSTLQRACRTAEILGTVKNLTPVKVEAFREIHFGEWEGKNSSELRTQQASAWEDFFRNPATAKAPGGESMGELQNRAFPALRKMLASHPEGDVALVAHGGVIRVLICAMLGLDVNRVWNIHVANAATTCFYYWGDAYTLEYANLNHYLDCELSGTSG